MVHMSISLACTLASTPVISMLSPLLALLLFTKLLSATEILELVQDEKPKIINIPATSDTSDTAETTDHFSMNLVDILEKDLCTEEMILEHMDYFYSPLMYPAVKDGGLNRYPIHLAIMHNSDKCIQLITHHYYESYGESADINDLHDYLMQNVLDYAIQYYPQISLRFLTHNIIKNDKSVENVLKLTMFDNPLPHVDLLATLTIKSPKDVDTLAKVLEMFIVSDYCNSEVYEIFLRIYLGQVFRRGFNTTENRPMFLGTLMYNSRITYEVFQKVYFYAMKYKCYTLLKSEELKAFILWPEDTKLLDQIAPAFLTEAKKSKDPLVVKYTLNFLEYKFVNVKIFKTGKDQISWSLYDRALDKYPPVAKKDFIDNLWKVFDLDFIPDEIRDGADMRRLQFIFLAECIIMILKRDDLFESKTDEQKAHFLEVLPQYMWHTIPVDFAIALHNPGALKYLFESEVKKRKFINEPVYVGDRGEFVPTVIDLVACYAPESYPKNSLLKLDASEYDDVLKKSTKFVESEACPVAPERKGEFMKQHTLKRLARTVGKHSKLPQFKAAMIDRPSREVKDFLESVMRTATNCKMAYTIAVSRDMKIPLSHIVEMLNALDDKLKSPYEARRSRRETISEAAFFVLKMLELGIKEDDSNTQDFVNLQYKILEYMRTYEGYIHPTFRVILVKLWGMRPEIVNEENPVKPVEESVFMGDDLDILGGDFDDDVIKGDFDDHASKGVFDDYIFKGDFDDHADYGELNDSVIRPRHVHFSLDTIPDHQIIYYTSPSADNSVSNLASGSLFRFLLSINSKSASHALVSLCKMENLCITDEDFTYAEYMLNSNLWNDPVLVQKFKLFHDFAEYKLRKQRENE